MYLFHSIGYFLIESTTLHGFLDNYYLEMNPDNQPMPAGQGGQANPGGPGGQGGQANPGGPGGQGGPANPLGAARHCATCHMTGQVYDIIDTSLTNLGFRARGVSPEQARFVGKCINLDVGEAYVNWLKTHIAHSPGISNAMRAKATDPNLANQFNDYDHKTLKRVWHNNRV